LSRSVLVLRLNVSIDFLIADILRIELSPDKVTGLRL